MIKSKKVKGSLFALAILLILSFSLGLTVIHATYKPGQLAQRALKSTPAVKVTVDKNLTIFKPNQGKTRPAILFYQGALVEATSYSYLAMGLATAGYPVYLLHHPLNLPVLAMKTGDQVIENYDLTEVVVGGHSLGGVVASRFAHREQASLLVKGVFFLGSYPDKKGDLSSLHKPVLSLTATEDQIMNRANYETSRQYLPQQTSFIAIKGGNHSGFGAYGQQKKDGKASLTTAAQQRQVVTYLLEWLEQI